MIEVGNVDGQIDAQLAGKTIKHVWKNGISLVIECTDGHSVSIGFNEGGFYHQKTDVSVVLPGVKAGCGVGFF